MTVPTLYENEARIRRCSFSSTQGASVTLELPDMDAMQAFLGNEGKRVALVAILIGDDETPVAPKVKEPRKRSARAFLLTKDQDFQRYASTIQDWPESQEGADTFLKYTCDIGSKAKLDTDEDAGAEFEALCTRFNAWQEARR